MEPAKKLSAESEQHPNEHKQCKEFSANIAAKRGRAASRKKRNKTTVVVLCILLVGLAVYAYFALDWRPLLGKVWELFTSPQKFREFILGFGSWMPFAYFMAQVFQVLIAPIPGVVVGAVGGILFGVWGGIALSLAGAVAGSLLVFYIGRRWGRPVVVKIVGEEVFNKYIGVLDEKGIVLFIIFILPFLPDDAVCALAGLSKVSYRRFFALVTIGRIPSVVTTVVAAEGMVSNFGLFWIVLGVFLLVSLVVGYVYKDRLEEWILRLAGKNKEGKEKDQ
ncbi:TVP38/TMEM64 family protein [Numidum massiliense]|uniref:TVP38/TMEM64 family protein n=1 Tax=Numidum massiliense TaxID=1522315 RepID=UPI0006D53382|nr:TVP38/TMEM64 family protein [Numidum massiliense]